MKMTTTAVGKHLLPYLKLIGVGLFLWIVSQLDLHTIWSYVRQANPAQLSASLVTVFSLYFVRAVRWQVAVRAMGIPLSYAEAWHVYTIGLFLAAITPGKVGELGRAAYLTQRGAKPATAVTLSIGDRLADVVCIAILGSLSLGVFFGVIWCLAGGLAMGFGVVVCWMLVRYTSINLAIYRPLYAPATLLKITVLTLIGWLLYFTWATLLARSLGIHTELLTLWAAFTLTGLLSLLPIAPSGLGTRDAALLTLLGPLGVASEQAVALALLMFVSILVSVIPGGWYWLRPSGPRQAD